MNYLSILESLVPVSCEDSHFFNKNKTTISINKISLIITIPRPPNLYRSHHPHTNDRYPKIIFPISEKQKEITPTKLKTGHCYVILKVAQKKAIYMEGSRWTRDEEIRIHPCSPWRGRGKTDDAIPKTHYTSSGAVFYLGNEPAYPLSGEEPPPILRDSRLCLWKLPIKVAMKVTVLPLAELIRKLI